MLTMRVTRCWPDFTQMRNSVTGMIPSHSTSLFLAILASWPLTFSGAVLPDLFVNPRRALLRYRLIKARRRIEPLFRKGEYDKVEEMAQLTLELSSRAGSDYLRQAAIFLSHYYWGASRNARGDVKGAAAHLIECVKIEGTPGLRLMVPPMFLAQAMIERGEKQATVAFLVELQRWWVCGVPLDEAVCKERKRLVKEWIDQAGRGSVPKGLPWYPKRFYPSHQ